MIYDPDYYCCIDIGQKSNNTRTYTKNTVSVKECDVHVLNIKLRLLNSVILFFLPSITLLLTNHTLINSYQLSSSVSYLYSARSSIKATCKRLARTTAKSQAMRPRAVLRGTVWQSAQGCTIADVVLLLLGCTSEELYIS